MAPLKEKERKIDRNKIEQLPEHFLTKQGTIN
jgi:hypothetical protein